MDLTQDITYRTYLLNDADIRDNIVPGNGNDSGIAGCVVDSADLSDVDVVQFMEKRSLQDGVDVGDVYLGARRLRMAGTLYGTSRAALYDAIQELRAACSPTLAQRESPGDKGYLPLYFSVPTKRTSDYPSGFIDLRVNALPRSFQAIYQRDHIGGEGEDALAIPWQANFVMRDPRIMSRETRDTAFAETTVVTGATISTGDVVTSAGHGLSDGDRMYFTSLTGGAGLSTATAYFVISSTTDTFKVSTTEGGSAVNVTTAYTDADWAAVVTESGNYSNRGDYHAPLNILLNVGPEAGTIAVTAGGSVMTITVPSSTGDRLIRYNGEEKYLTFEEDDDEQLQMGRMTFTNSTTHPLVPAGTSAYSVTFIGVTVLVDSHMWFWESYA